MAANQIYLRPEKDLSNGWDNNNVYQGAEWETQDEGANDAFMYALVKSSTAPEKSTVFPPAAYFWQLAQPPFWWHVSAGSGRIDWSSDAA